MNIKGKTVALLGRHRLLTDVIAGFLFITVGIIFALLAATGNITMGIEKPIEETLGAGVMNLVRTVRGVPYSEYLFAALLIVFIIFLIRKGRKS